MPGFIEKPTVVRAAGMPPKQIEEFIGRVNTGETRLSLARMRSPEGWCESGQRPEFEEFTLVLEGMLRVEHEAGARRSALNRSYRAHRLNNARKHDEATIVLTSAITIGT